MDMNELRVYTAQEADTMIPKLRETITQLRGFRNRLLAKEAEMDALELICEGNKESPEIIRVMREYDQTARDFYQLLNQMTQQGCHLKELDAGLVDFYGMHGNKLVYLCWKMDEDRVTHWHEIGQGFASRQTLERKE